MAFDTSRKSIIEFTSCIGGQDVFLTSNVRFYNKDIWNENQKTLLKFLQGPELSGLSRV